MIAPQPTDNPITSAPFTTDPFGQNSGRIMYCRNARRLLYNEHHELITERMRVHLGIKRSDVVAKLVDLSTCTLKRAAAAQATLYDLPPTFKTEDQGQEGLEKEIDASGVWAMMPRHQRDTLALRQNLLLLSIDQYGDEAPELVVESIPPDLFHAVGRKGNPGKMARLFVAREYELPKEMQPPAVANGLEAPKRAWFWEDYDLRDPKAPAFRILSSYQEKDGQTTRTRLKDWTAAMGIELAEDGWLKHARDKTGAPVMPGIKYDAQKITTMFDSFENLGLYEGSLNVSMGKTHFLHILKSASWRQKYAIGLRLGGASVQGEGQAAASHVALDPALLAIFEAAEGFEGQGTVGTMEAPVDPADFLGAVHLYERDIIADSGLRSPSVQKMAGDPRSGQALEVDRDDERKLQERYRPSFGRADALMLRVAACMLNRAKGTSYPERGYVVAYQGVPESSAERKAKREDVLAKMDAGMMDPVAAYMALNPGKTEDQATADLVAIQQRRMDLGLLPRNTQQAA